MLLRTIKKKLRNNKKNKSSPLLFSSLILLNFKLSVLRPIKEKISNFEFSWCNQPPVTTIQLKDDLLWSRLNARQPIATRQRDEEHRFLPDTRSTSPTDYSDEFSSELTDQSPPSSQFAFTPATWTPQESQQISPIPPTLTPSHLLDNTDMADITNCSFTGKPEDQDPQDFMNRLERIILMKTGLTEPEKIRFLELSLKAQSPAAAWFVTLTDGSKKSFATVRTAFEVRWPVKATTQKTTAEKQALLDECYDFYTTSYFSPFSSLPPPVAERSWYTVISSYLSITTYCLLRRSIAQYGAAMHSLLTHAQSAYLCTARTAHLPTRSLLVQYIRTLWTLTFSS